jgi:beta-phosphoglucomutase
MSPVKALLVDLDGTLVETAGANFEAYSEALTEFGLSIGRERFDAIAQGKNWKQFLPPLLAEAGLKIDPAMVNRRKAEIYATKMHQTKVNTALVRLVDMVRPLSRTALVTTASAINVQAVIAHHGLGRLFDVIVTGDDVDRHKPDPQAYQLAARHLDVSPEECLVIEDSDAGVASAHAFGAMVLRVQTLI